MLAGRFLRECPEAVERINLTGVGEYIDENENTERMADIPHRSWYWRVLSHPDFQRKAQGLAALAREIGGEISEPWRD
jgi:hypothetical protein